VKTVRQLLLRFRCRRLGFRLYCCVSHGDLLPLLSV
jgi:hypothetical protein